MAAAEVQLNYEVIAAGQKNCQDTQAARKTSLSLQKVKFGEVELLCDTSGPQPHRLIPAAHRRTVFTAFQQHGPRRGEGDRQGAWGESGVASHEESCGWLLNIQNVPVNRCPIY
jgi:hypothetical protein